MKRFIYYLLTLLGFGVQGCDNLDNPFGGEEVCMYGVPTLEFHVSARVVDADGNPIQGIELRTKSGAPCDDKTGFSDYQGVIDAYYHGTGFADDVHKVLFIDVDGGANGGVFLTQELDIKGKLVQVESKDDWYQGGYYAELGDVVLSRDNNAQEPEVGVEHSCLVNLSVVVENEEGEPIQGIFVYPEGGEFAGREGYSDYLGRVVTSSTLHSVDGKFVIHFEDVDGEYNLGVYESVSVDITDEVLAAKESQVDIVLQPVVMKRK